MIAKEGGTYTRPTRLFSIPKLCNIKGTMEGLSAHRCPLQGHVPSHVQKELL